MSTIKIILKKYSMPILAGICIGTTYIPFFPWALTFCLVPLWFFWFQQKASLKTLFIGSWLTQFILNLIGFHWVAHTAIEFGGFPAPIGYIILILFASIAHLYYPIAAVLWGWAQKRWSLPMKLLMIPLIFALCESFYPTIFFWHLGYPWLWIKMPIIGLAEWIGFYGINLITLFINLSILIFVISRKKRALIGAFAIVAVANLLGMWIQSRYLDGGKDLNVLVVQGNIGNSVKLEQDKGPQYHNIILNTFKNLTEQGLQKNASKGKVTDLIIWPETAFPSLINGGDGKVYMLQRSLQNMVRTWQVPLMTGAYQDENDHRDVFNSLVMIDKNGNVQKSYHKTMLLAFGEYFPGANILPQLLEWFPMVSNFGRGSGPTVLPLDINDHQVNVGAQICYESLFDDFSKSVYKQGASFIVNVTNDSWFGKDFEPYQHLYMTLARAIEFRIPLIRSTNTGISTAISAKGTIAEFSPMHTEWAGTFSIKYQIGRYPTLYSYYAGLWPWILAVICALVTIGGFVVKPRDP